MRNKDTNRSEFTGGQLALKEIVEELGFAVDMEAPFLPYCIDLMLFGPFVAIEYDGSGHWKKKDKKRDAYLMENYNLPVLRLDKFSPKLEVQQKILDFIWEWQDSADKRKEVLWKT